MRQYNWGELPSSGHLQTFKSVATIYGTIRLGTASNGAFRLFQTAVPSRKSRSARTMSYPETSEARRLRICRRPSFTAHRPAPSVLRCLAEIRAHQGGAPWHVHM